MARSPLPSCLKRLDIVGAQVKYHAAQQFSRAAMQAAAQRSGGVNASDRAYQVTTSPASYMVFVGFIKVQGGCFRVTI